jgi:long-chain fatty acid transport protein
MTRFRTLIVALGFLGAFASTAHAGGIYTATFGGEEGHVTTSHPSATYYNPAGLALRGGTRFVLEGTLGYRTLSYDRPTSAIDNPGSGTPSDALGTNSGHADLTNPLAVPFVGAATDFGVKNLGVGVSLSVPFGGSADWGKNEAYEGNQTYPGAVDGVQRWAIINGTVQAIYLTGAVAYYIPAAHLSIGAGLNVVSQKIDVLRARNAQSTDDQIIAGQFIEGRALIEADSVGFAAGAGLIFMPMPELRLGLSYQSQPDFGKTTMTGTIVAKIGRAPTAPAQPIDFEQELPDVIRFGASYQLNPKVELRAELDYQRWSAFDKQCVLDRSVENRNCTVDATGKGTADAAGIVANLDRQWSDSMTVHVGGTYWLMPAVQLMGGIGYDTNAVPDSTLDAAFVDSNKVLVTAQGRFELGGGFALSARWMQVICASREAPAIEPAVAPTRVPSSFGKYTQSVGIFSLAAEYEF